MKFNYDAFYLYSLLINSYSDSTVATLEGLCAYENEQHKYLHRNRITSYGTADFVQHFPIRAVDERFVQPLLGLEQCFRIDKFCLNV